MTETTEKQLLAPPIAEDALEQARALIGMPIRVEQYNYEATRDTIRHYAWGIGDDNPLFYDADYAGGSKWGGIIAPPTFFFGIWDAVVAPGLPDVRRPRVRRRIADRQSIGNRGRVATAHGDAPPFLRNAHVCRRVLQ